MPGSPNLPTLDARCVSIVSRLGPDTLYLIVSKPRFIKCIKLCILLYPDLSQIHCISLYPKSDSMSSASFVSHCIQTCSRYNVSQCIHRRLALYLPSRTRMSRAHHTHITRMSNACHTHFAHTFTRKLCVEFNALQLRSGGGPDVG